MWLALRKQDNCYRGKTLLHNGYTTLRLMTLCLLNHYVVKAFCPSVIVKCRLRRNMFRRILSTKYFMLTICCHNVSADHVRADIYANSEIFCANTPRSNIFHSLEQFYLSWPFTHIFSNWLIGACPTMNFSIQVCFYKVLGSNLLIHFNVQWT